MTNSWLPCDDMVAPEGNPDAAVPCVLPYGHTGACSAVLPDADLQPVCSVCGRPAIYIDGRPAHAEAVDAGFCEVLRTIAVGPVR